MRSIFLMTLTASVALCQQDLMIQGQALPIPGANNKTITVFSRSSTESVVKGAPYSADSVTETVQVLADGNRITHSNKSSFARDSEGRTRRESTIQGLGRLGRTEAPIVSVFIEDPVAKVGYTLDAKNETAYKTKSDAAASRMPFLETKIRTEQVFVDRQVSGVSVTTAAPMEIRRHLETRNSDNVKTDDLGTRNIEGLPAKGTRTTMTIAAGEMGNERPIEVVTETWYSSELKTNVLTRHNDPRMGETTTRLMNVKIAEPSRSLFEPPADYKVQEDTGMRTAMPAIRVREDR